MTGVVETAEAQPRWPFAVQQFAAQLVDRLPRLLRTPRAQPQRVYVRTPDGRNDAVWIGGRHIGQADLSTFIDGLDPETARAQLRALTPASYIGRAEALAKKV